MALKNLGAIFGKEEGSLRALYYLRRSFEINPQDPQTVYGLAFACMELGDIQPDQMHFRRVQNMDVPKELRSGQEWAVGDCRPRASRPGDRGRTTVFYPGAMRLFRGKSPEELQEITFEIGEIRG